MMRFFLPILLISVIFSCKKNNDTGTATVNSIQNIINDTKLPHEALLHGVPLSYGWAQVPGLGMGNDPGAFTAIVAWGQVYEAAQGNMATNTRVQLKDLETWYLSKADLKWHLIQQTADGIEGGAYVEDFVNNVSKYADVRPESDGGISATAGGGYNFHFWPAKGRSLLPTPVTDIKGIFVTILGKLVVNDKSQPDDRYNAKYLLGVGADYWSTLTAPWNNFLTNQPVALGTMKIVKKDWIAFNMCTMTEDEIRNYPPPIK
jgi:hypothetical protein